MSSSAVRQRGGKRGATDAETTPTMDTEDAIKQFKGVAKETVQREWDYKLALAVITVLAFITRFWGISHPNQVVFDEVHFGKVRIWICQSIRIKSKNSDHPLCSSHPTTFSAPTSSMCILPLASSCSHSLDGWLDTMDLSSSRTLATRTSPTKFHTSHTDRCLP
jgi:hypothetical protein